MNHSTILLITVLCLICIQLNANCENHISAKESASKVVCNKTDNNSQDDRINLDLILNEKHNEYLATFKDGTLSLCCYNLLNLRNNIDFKHFNKEIEEYKTENLIKKVDVYYYGNSYLKMYYNNHPNVMHTDLVCGKICSNDLISKIDVKLGMGKTELLEKLFQSSELFEAINRLDIYENELGESYTSYQFENEKLKEIVFDSDYDWIDKEFNKEHNANKPQ